MTTVPGTARRPADRQRKRPTIKQRLEAAETPVEFEFDGEHFVVTPADATSLEFLAALEDQQLIAAVRMLLGTEQAARLFKGRKVEDLEGFFERMGEATGSGNP